jgi:hypothetical protein
MGLFDAIKKAVSQVSTSAVSSAKAMQDAQGYNGNTGSSKSVNTANSSTELAPGVRNYDIVGESFRPDSFERLQTEFEKEDGDTVEVEVTVKIDPNNPHAKNGKAVGVYISEQLVGYIPNLDAEKMFDFLKKRKGIGTCQGTVYFDSSSEKPMNSVQLHMQWPPIYLDEATQNAPNTRPTGTPMHEVSASEPQLAFLNGSATEFVKHGEGYSLVSKLQKMGLDTGDIFFFDNVQYVSSMATTSHPELQEGEVGLLILGELAAKSSVSIDPSVHTIIEKNGGLAAVRSHVLVKENGPTYFANVSGARLSKSKSNNDVRPPLLIGTFNGIAEVDVDVTGRSKDNLDYEVKELLKLKDGNTAFVIGAVCLFRGQKSDNVFVQAGDTVGGVKGAAKEVLRTFIAKNGYDDGYRIAVSAWLMISRKSQNKNKVELVLDQKLSLKK